MQNYLEHQDGLRLQHVLKKISQPGEIGTAPVQDTVTNPFSVSYVVRKEMVQANSAIT